MTTTPHDLPDLYLAPVVLELDRRLEAMTGRAVHQLDIDVALATDRQPIDAERRSALMLATLTHLLTMHGWVAGWDPRGLRLSHESHRVVLGLPASVRAYLAN